MARIRVADIEDVPVGSGREIVAGDRVLALFHGEDGWFAIDGICAHAGGPIAQGALNGHIVTCPWHGWQYDIRDGQHCLSPGICQASFPVSIEGNDVFVDCD